MDASRTARKKRKIDQEGSNREAEISPDLLHCASPQLAGDDRQDACGGPECSEQHQHNISGQEQQDTLLSGALTMAATICPICHNPGTELDPLCCHVSSCFHYHHYDCLSTWCRFKNAHSCTLCRSEGQHIAFSTDQALQVVVVSNTQEGRGDSITYDDDDDDDDDNEDEEHLLAVMRAMEQRERERADQESDESDEYDYDSDSSLSSSSSSSSWG